MGLFILVNLVTLVMLIWFKSDAVVEWFSLIGLKKLIKKREYIDMRMEQMPIDINYPTFLKMRYKNFITKMLACSLCFCVWISTILCLVISFFTSFWFMLMMPTIVILSMITYGVVTSLVKLV